MQAELEKRGGTILAISVDTPAENLQVVQSQKLGFRILSDQSRAVTSSYGLLHEGGGPDGGDIPVPAMLLLRSDASVTWKHVSKMVVDRVDPSDVVAAVRAL